MAALDWARKTGRARFTGISSHHRPHIKSMIEKYPDQLQVVLTPYTADTKVVTDESGLWAAIKKHDVGWFGIKPFASNSLFKGDSSPARARTLQGRQPPGPAGHSLRALQPLDHGPDPGPDQREAGRQRGAGRSRNAGCWTRSEQPSSRRHGIEPGPACRQTTTGSATGSTSEPPIDCQGQINRQ